MKKKRAMIVFIVFYAIFLIFSVIFDFKPGRDIANNLVVFLKDMIKIIPCAFILIGLFEVWVKRESVERHLGEESGLRGYIFAILLAGTTMGGLYVAFPVAYSLYNKGARAGVVFAYIGAAAICRIPMTIFEATFVGMGFSIIRLLVSLPLVLFSSAMLEKYVYASGYKICKIIEKES